MSAAKSDIGMGIAFVGVSKRYGESADAPKVVDNVSFDVPQGTLTTILGPSGCGKTTTLRMIAGLERPTSGRVWIQGRDVTDLGPSERHLSMMFQSYALFPHLDVLGNVMYGLRMSGVPTPQASTRAAEALRQVGLLGLDARFPSELSGGQQQRVALARALVLEPAVLLFDEPLSNLDARLRREMREEIRALQQRLGLTVAYVTHDQGEAMAVSDHIIVMRDGVIAQQGTPRELYEQPRDAFVAGFMGEAQLYEAQALNATTVQLGPLTWTPRQTMTAGPVQVAVRPEAWRIQANGGLPARLRQRAYLGNSWEYVLETPLGRVWVVSSDMAQVWSVGDAVGLHLAPQGVSVISSPAAHPGAG
jgi:iron(III) transport system ATP-binding protein